METIDFTLEDFLLDTGQVVEDVIAARQILFHQDIRETIKEAWDELTENNSTAWLNKRCKEIKKAKSDQKRSKKFKDVGLYGAQLKAKLKGFSRIFNHFKFYGGLKKLRSLLDWIISILGSLASALGPLGCAIEAFKELIELIKRSVNDTEMLA